MGYRPTGEGQLHLMYMKDKTPYKEASFWMSDLEERVDDFTGATHRILGSSGGHRFSKLFNIASGVLNAIGLVVPAVAPVAAIGGMVVGGVGIYGAFGRLGQSEPFVTTGENLKREFTELSEEAGTDAPKGLMEAVDQYKSGIQSLYKISKTDLAVKAGFAAAAGVGLLIGAGGPLLVCAGFAAYNAAHAVYNARSEPHAKTIEEAGEAIKGGVADIRKALLRKRMAEEDAAPPGPAPAAF